MPDALPPPKYQRHAGHHWLSDDVGMLVVLQWNPVQKVWMKSNDMGSCDARPISTSGWKWLAHIEPPPIEEETK